MYTIKQFQVVFCIILLCFIEEDSCIQGILLSHFIRKCCIRRFSCSSSFFSVAEDVTGRLDFVGVCGEFNQHKSALISDEHDYIFLLWGLSLFNLTLLRATDDPGHWWKHLVICELATCLCGHSLFLFYLFCLFLSELFYVLFWQSTCQWRHRFLTGFITVRLDMWLNQCDVI